MKRIFIASPLRGDYELNLKLAKFLCMETTRAGHAAFAPHVFYTLFLDEHLATDRQLGIEAGCRWLKAADECWVYATDFEACSEGMRAEVKIAALAGVRIAYMPDVFKLAKEKWETVRHVA